MATDAVNLTTTTITTAAVPLEGNPSKTVEATFPPSTKPDQVKDSAIITSSTVDSGTDRVKKNSDDSNGSKNSPLVSDTEKKIRRAERFGITVQLSEEEKRNSRAERFGTKSTPHASDTVKKSEELKRKSRAERFGLPTAQVASDEEAKKKARLERFASAPKTNEFEEEKKKARAIRFSESPSNNGNGHFETLRQGDGPKRDPSGGS